MKAVIGIAGAAVVLATGGVDAFSSSMASLALATAAGCWFVSGWIFD